MNKFLKQYPQLREPKIGDTVLSIDSRYSKLFHKTGVIEDIVIIANTVFYKIIFDGLHYHYRKENFKVVVDE